MSMRAYRAQSPTSSYHTEYTLVVGHGVQCYTRIRVDVPIRSS